MKTFKLGTEEMELLLAFEGGEGIEALSKAIGRDPTVISRMLKRISEKAPALEKVSGRWKITDLGKKLNSLTRDMLIAQDSLLTQKFNLRVGTNREFAARVFIKSLAELKKSLAVDSLTIRTFESGTEQALLEGLVDISIDCGKPYSTDIKFKYCANEAISIVCAPNFYKKNRKEFDADNYRQLPMILCERLFPDRIDPNELHQNHPQFSFNDIAAARAACIEGLGWMFAPIYAVQCELDEKILVRPYAKSWGQEKYSVWYLRSRRQLVGKAKVFEDWLAVQSLG